MLLQLLWASQSVPPKDQRSHEVFVNCHLIFLPAPDERINPLTRCKYKYKPIYTMQGFKRVGFHLVNAISDRNAWDPRPCQAWAPTLPWIQKESLISSNMKCLILSHLSLCQSRGRCYSRCLKYHHWIRVNCQKSNIMYNYDVT